MIVSTEEALDSPENDRSFLENNFSFTQNTTIFFKEGWHNFKEIVTFLLGSDVPSGPPSFHIIREKNHPGTISPQAFSKNF